MRLGKLFISLNSKNKHYIRDHYWLWRVGDPFGIRWFIGWEISETRYLDEIIKSK